MAESTPAQKLAALEEENARLCQLAITLPVRLAQADEHGEDFFAVMIYGYELCYTKDTFGWRAYVSDTAD